MRDGLNVYAQFNVDNFNFDISNLSLILSKIHGVAFCVSEADDGSASLN